MGGISYNNYKCKHCGKVVKREGNKQWIKSYCSEVGKTVRLIITDRNPFFLNNKLK